MKSKSEKQVGVSNGDAVKRKYVLYILIAILIVSSSILVLRIGNDFKNKNEVRRKEREAIKEEAKKREEEAKKKLEEERRKQEKLREEAKKEQEKNSFNNKFSFKAGTSSKSSVSWTLDDVMTNNKTNKEHLIEVIYKDKSYGTTYDEIIKIKSLLKDFDGYNLVHYEVSFEYNDAGYIYKMIIK